MALQFSTALRNAVGSGMSWNEALANGRLYVYSGSQPANADADVSGTLLCIFNTDTNGVAANYTAPTQCVAKATVGGTSGTINALTIGGASNATGFDIMNGAVTWTSSNAATATLLATNINSKVNPFGITANANGADVELRVPAQYGAAFNTINAYANVTTATLGINGANSTLGATGGFSAGVNAANGLNFQPANSGAIAKTTTAWKANATANGTAGWFRYVSGGSSATGASTTDFRVDGSIATSGGDLTLSSLTITSGAVQTINTFTFTVPAA